MTKTVPSEAKGSIYQIDNQLDSALEESISIVVTETNNVDESFQNLTRDDAFQRRSEPDEGQYISLLSLAQLKELLSEEDLALKFSPIRLA